MQPGDVGPASLAGPSRTSLQHRPPGGQPVGAGRCAPIVLGIRLPSKARQALFGQGAKYGIYCLYAGESRRNVPRMPRPLRAVVVGTGFIGRVHARSIRLAGASLVGVAASSVRVGRRRPQPNSAPSGAFAAAEDAVEADDVDVVHICTPNHLHEPLALRALAAGKHVVCEKPVALDADGAARVAAAAWPRPGWSRCRSCTASTRWCARRGRWSATARSGRCG